MAHYDLTLGMPIAMISKETGISRAVLEKLVLLKKIKGKGQYVSYEDYEVIKEQNLKYISMDNFSRLQEGPRYSGNKAKDRNSLFQFIVENEFFGCETISRRKIIFADEDVLDVYIKREDIDKIVRNCKNYLEWYGYSTSECVEILTNNTKGLNTKKYILSFLETQTYDAIRSKMIFEFAKIVCEAEDITKLTSSDVGEMINRCELKATKETLIKFLRYVKDKTRVKYGTISTTQKTSGNKTISAYSNEEIVKLAEILFNEDYISNNNLISKALDNPLYAKLWLYIAAHFVCGWRSADICNNWRYPEIKDGAFGVNPDTLESDIRNGIISEETYTKISDYVVNRIAMASNLPSKTAPFSKLTLAVTILPDLAPAFGRMELICAYHERKSSNGKLNWKEVSDYKRWSNCKDFFGPTYYSAFGTINISSRGLNKSFLQSIEDAAINSGNTPLTAHITAAFARGHVNANSTLHYLSDHAMTGETAAVIIYLMMQRGVLSVYAYTALLTAMPDTFEKMTKKDQTKLLSTLNLSAYEIETISTTLIAEDSLKKAFISLDADECTDILKAMYQIGLGNGTGKEEGVYCLRRALGMTCSNPAFETCVGNECPYHVFTKNGVQTLVDVIKSYGRKYKETGNRKYLVVLKTKMIPLFREIMKRIGKEMSQEEQMQITKYIEEKMNG